MTNQYNRFNDQIIDEFRANDGEVNRFGSGLVLIHHIGAKSGVERVSPAMSIRRDADTWLVAASKAGAPENPAWYHNLLANPDVIIEAAGEGEVAVHVTDLRGQDRDAAWAQFTAISPGFRQYETMTTRVIPVLELTRVAR